MKSSKLVATTSAASQTQQLARALSGLCGPGDVIVLAGEMGAGKTAFAQGFAVGLGISEQVTSPTFTIVREYSGPDLPLHHLDVYRLEQLREVTDTGGREMLDEEAVMLVEWGDAVLPALGDQYLEVRITFGADDDDRILTFAVRGTRWAARERALAELLTPWRTQDGQEPGPC